MLDIRKEWENPDRKIACIEGDFALDVSGLPTKYKVWDFRSGLTVTEFFDEFVYWMGSSKNIRSEFLPISGKVSCAKLLLKLMAYPSLIALQGFEALQYGSGDDYGLIKDKFFKDWLRFFALGNHNHFCVISGDFPVLDLMDFTTISYLN